MKTNSSRFEQYVNSIILLISVIKSRQAIIDLSVNRSKKCSSCTNDNYNFYGCSFGFICKFVNLPILPIPPFRIPSVYMDFSSINAQISIELPRINFVPTSINLPQLPNLPSPPNFLLDMDINTERDLIFQ